MKRFLSLLLIVVMLLSVAGCGQTPAAVSPSSSSSSQSPADNNSSSSGDTAEKITLRFCWWGGDVRHERTMKVCEMFSALYPNVTIETEYGAESTYWDKLTTQAAANNQPDIMQLDYTYFDQWNSKKLVQNLTPYVEAGDLKTKDIRQDLLQAGYYNGVLTAIPTGTTPLGMLYDKDILDDAGLKYPEPGFTWDNFFEYSKVVYEKTGKNTLVQAISPIFYLYPWVRERGYSLYNEDGTALGFDDPAIIAEFLEVPLKLMEIGSLPDVDTLFVSGAKQEDNLLVNGNSWCELTWGNFVIAFSNLAEKQLSVTVPPMSKDKVKNGLFLKPSQLLSIANNSKHGNMAAKFIDYFINDIDANLVLFAERGIPGNTKVLEVLQEKAEGPQAAWLEYGNVAAQYSSQIDPPDPSGYSEIKQAIKDAFDQVVYKKSTPEEAAKVFMQTANDVLAKNK